MSNIQVFTTSTGKRSMYYHTNWSMYGRDFQVSDIPSCVTDLVYAFWNVDASGNVTTTDSWSDTDKRFTSGRFVTPADSWNDASGLFGNFGQFQKLRNSGRQINISLAIGGWTLSSNFSNAMSTEISRSNIITGILTTFNKFPIFSGVTIDWEYVSNDGVNYGNSGNVCHPADSDNFILFLKELRTAFNSNGMTNNTIAMCCTAAPEKCKFNVELTHPLLDQLHVMTYDMHDGNWGETVTAHHTNPRKSSFGKYSCEEAADYYINRGVTSSKIFIGAAFYSRGFSNTDGVGKPASGGSPDMSWEKGCVDYKGLPVTGSIEYFDDEAKAAYSYDATRKVFNSYDNVNSIIEKCRIVYQKNLAGLLIWENSADLPIQNSRSLVATIRDNLTNGQPSGTDILPAHAIPVIIAPAPIPAPIPEPMSAPIPAPMPVPMPAPMPIPIPAPMLPIPIPAHPIQNPLINPIISGLLSGFKGINITCNIDINTGTFTNGVFSLKQ